MSPKQAKKILLSAFYAKPNQGSEYAVGWNWAVELAKKGNQVWVLTRSNFKQQIEEELALGRHPENLHFFFYDLPKWIAWWAKGERGIHVHYFLWQVGAYGAAKRKHAKELFDMVQHITFVSTRQPSFMGGLGIPFIFGPVGGGERAPWKLRKNYGFRGHLRELLRDSVNAFVRFDPLMRGVFKKARKIIVTSEQTKALIPKKFHEKVTIQLAIGASHGLIQSNRPKNNRTGKRLLFIGRFIHWKGMNAGLKAFSEALKTDPTLTLTMIGEGPREKSWRRECHKLGISCRVEWVPWVPQEKVASYYASHDVLLFPSHHDSGGMVVLEAMAHGIPVICLALGGPGAMVNEKCGRVISVKDANGKEVEDRLAGAICEITGNPSLAKQLSTGAIARVRDFEWNKVVEKTYRTLTSDFFSSDLALVTRVIKTVFPKGTKVFADASDASSRDRYLVISGTKGPRWIVPERLPFAQKRIVFKYLSQWCPYSAIFDVVWACVPLAYLLGFLRHLPYIRRIGISSPSPVVLKRKGWGYEAPLVPVIHIGFKNVSRKATVGFIDPKKLEAVAVAKFALEPIARRTNKIEAVALARLAKEIPGVAPRLFYAESNGEVLIQAAVRGKSLKKNLRQQHFEFLKQLKRSGQTTTLKKVAHNLKSEIKNCRHEERAILADALKQLDDTNQIPVVWAHGDFFPWNLLMNDKSKLVALDWEFSNPNGLPLYDIVHFYCIEELRSKRKVGLEDRIKSQASDYLKFFEIKQSMLNKLILACLVENWLYSKKRQHERKADLIFEKIRNST